VEHQGRVHIIEDAGLQFDDLAPRALFAGGADDAQRAGEENRAADDAAETAALPATIS